MLQLPSWSILGLEVPDGKTEAISESPHRGSTKVVPQTSIAVFWISAM